MKKIIYILLAILLCSSVYAQEFPLVKLAEFENKKEVNCLYIRKLEELDPYDDGTGSGIIINNENGEIYIAQTEMKLLYKLNTIDYKLSIKQDFNVLTLYDAFNTITDRYYFCSGYLGRFKLFDKAFNKKFEITMQDYGIKLYLNEAYYLEDANVLFFWDNKENIYSIVNPGMDKEENRKNFHNTEETKRMFESDVEINGVKIRVTSSNDVFIDGKMHFWKQSELGNYRYQKVTNDYFMVYNKNNIKEKYKIKFPNNIEVVESAAVHPSGDIYILSMNWATNTHNLYRIENTWDPEWREQWYKEHPEAN